MELHTIDFEGVKVIVDTHATIKPGDTYLAKRNTGWKLLTCKSVHPVHGYIIPVELEYPYDISDCHKVVSI